MKKDRDMILIEKLTGVIPNKYEAVRVMAREARRINALIIRGAPGEIDEKPTMMALRRLLEGKVKYTYADEETTKGLFEDD